MKRAALLVALFAASACDTTPEAKLLREFKGSYPEEARPTGTLREFTITAAPTEVPLVDGRRLQVWAYNGQVPGPTLRVRVGDTVRVRFENRLPQPSTIHWHGVRVPNNMDGVPHGTQAPVPPGGSFVYEFVPKDAGTFWFHPHVRSSEQVERGLYGVLVVEDRDPPPYDRDLVWVWDDWLLDESGQIFPQFNTRHDLAMDGRWGNFITVNGRTDTVLALHAGERVRLRILNSANGRVFAPDFGGLDAKIVAVDGLYVRTPFPASGFELAPGNRIDVDVTAPLASTEIPIVDRFYAPRPNALAKVLVDGLGGPPKRFAPPRAGYVPAYRDGLRAKIDQEIHLDARAGGPFGIEWMFNGHAFPDHQPIPLAFGKFHRVRFVNDSFRIHPIHLHGMFFKVLARGGQPVDEGYFRDTVLVHPKETVDVGVVPLDHGHWMMHCHILEHAEAGMMTMIEVN